MNADARAQETGGAPVMNRQERMSYARQIRGARLARGLTQQELADAAEVSRGTIGNIEDGKSAPQSDVLWRIMGVVDLRPEPPLPIEIEGWLRVLAPVIQQVPDAERERVMLRVLEVLAASVRKP